MLARTSKLALLIFLSYLGVAIVQTWPLTLHLSTQLPGPPGGDTGVYVWNTWVFRHELVDLGRSPFSTATILPLDGRTNLGLHNYTVFANLLTLPLQPWLGIVASFNVVYIVNVALSGFAMFVLARRLTGRIAESWIAGLVFAWSPFLVARGGSHFSLAAAAPIPLFVYWFDRAFTTTRAHDGALAGAMLAWAAFSDPYYAIYCVMLGVVMVVSRLFVLSQERASAGRRHAQVVIDVLIATLACLMIGVYGVAGGLVRIGSITITMRTLYTPMLVMTMLAAIRILITVRFSISWVPVSLRSIRMIATLGISTAILLGPELYAIVVLAAEGRFSRAPVLWRSSAPGVDLLSFFLPNPNHPLAPRAMVEWISRQPGNFEENVVSISWIGLAIILAARRWAAFRPNRLWLAITLGFASLTLGPFIVLAGHRTFIPTPWTLLRFLPLVGDARMPPRFGVVVMMGFAAIIASALVALGRRYPEKRRLILVTAATALALELLPAPRTLYSAEVPSIYRTIAADPRPVRVLELPFGIRDGLSSLGNFSAASQFYQTMHRKPLIGGYLSRVDVRTKDAYRKRPMLHALLTFSEGTTPTPEELQQARDSATGFLKNSSLGYVVIDVGMVTPELRQFAIDTLGLVRIEHSGPRELYVPAPH